MLDRLAVFRGGATLDAIRAVWEEPDVSRSRRPGDVGRRQPAANPQRHGEGRRGSGCWRPSASTPRSVWPRRDSWNGSALHAEWFAAWASTMDPLIRRTPVRGLAGQGLGGGRQPSSRDRLPRPPRTVRRAARADRALHGTLVRLRSRRRGTPPARPSPGLLRRDRAGASRSPWPIGRSSTSGNDPAKQAERAVALADARGDLPVKAFALQVLAPASTTSRPAARPLRRDGHRRPGSRSTTSDSGERVPTPSSPAQPTPSRVVSQYRSAHEALHVRQESVSAAERLGDQRIVSFALSRVAISHLVIGDTDSARHAVDRALALADTNHQIALRAWSSCNLRVGGPLRRQVLPSGSTVRPRHRRCRQRGPRRLHRLHDLAPARPADGPRPARRRRRGTRTGRSTRALPSRRSLAQSSGTTSAPASTDADG